MNDEQLSRAFVMLHRLQETHKTRDPLEGVDRLYVPEGANHDWGQQQDPARKVSNPTDDIKDVKTGNESGPSDSDLRLESQEGNKPEGDATTMDNVISNMKETDKYERCVQHVKANGDDVNPYAVCHSSVG